MNKWAIGDHHHGQPQQQQQPLPAWNQVGERYSFHDTLPNMFSELQHEVSSLLEFKNALLETFPHLQSRMSGSVGELAASRQPRLGASGGLDGLSGSTGQLSQAGFGSTNTRLMARHLDVVSSDDTQPSWTGLQMVGGQASSSGVSSGPLGSSIGRSRRSGPMGQVASENKSDSGFINTESNKDAGHPDHMRWSYEDEAAAGPTTSHSHGDELMTLLDLIQAKSERLRLETASDAASGGLATRKRLRVISENDFLHHQQRPLEAELEALHRERTLLIQRVAELEARRGSSSKGEAGSSPLLSGDSESSISGIVHSVHIRTGGENGSASVGSSGLSQGRQKRSKSVSHTDLHHDPSTAGQPGVHIEIKNMSKSQEFINTGNNSALHRLAGKSSTSRPVGVSVVSLKQPDNLPHFSKRLKHFGQPAKSSQLLRNASLLPGRMVPSHSASGSRPGPGYHVPSSQNKSRSVENLVDPSRTVLGLKPANSEVNVNAVATARIINARLTGTMSEMNVSKIGTSEKLKVFQSVEGVVSMPAELTRRVGHGGDKIRPNMERIRNILGMNSVIELQRQLLTTVMENEVYKTQLERVSEGWTSKMSSFERLNGSLKNSLAELQQENLELRAMVNKRNSELDSTKGRLRLLEQTVSSGGLKKGGSSNCDMNEDAAAVKSENRVHFDLSTSGTSAGSEGIGGRKPRPVTRPGGHRQTSQLPSDARQRLEQMATASSVVMGTNASRLNFEAASKAAAAAAVSGSSGSSSPVKSNLDPIQEMAGPVLNSGQPPTVPAIPSGVSGRMPVVRRNSSSLPTSGQGSVSNTLNNNHKAPGGLHQGGVRTRRESLGAPAGANRSRPQTPSSREVRTLNMTNLLGKSDISSPVVEQQQPGGDLLGSMDKKDIEELDLADMGRESIAGLIAGILHRQSALKVEAPCATPKEAFVQEEFQDISLDHPTEIVQEADTVEEEDQLFVRRLPPSTPYQDQCSSLPYSNRNRTDQTMSYQANNLLEELQLVSHGHEKLAIDVDSLSYKPAVDEDSLNFSMQQVEQDSLAEHNWDDQVSEVDSLHRGVGTPEPDSLAAIKDDPRRPNRRSEHLVNRVEVPPQQGKRKLIIPYNESSYSSTTSVFTPSRDGSCESCTRIPQEQDSLTLSSEDVTLDMRPLRNSLARGNPSQTSNLLGHMPHPPLSVAPGPRLPMQPELKPLERNQPKTYTRKATQNIPSSPETSPSLMKLATERMKRKLLGWN